jgi:hypothetical protein
MQTNQSSSIVGSAVAAERLTEVRTMTSPRDDTDVSQAKVGVMKIDGVKHGTDRAYKVHGCRCDLCKEAHNVARRKERQRRRANSQHDLLFELAEKYGYVLVPIEDFEEVGR